MIVLSLVLSVIMCNFVFASLPLDYKSPNMMYYYQFDEAAGSIVASPSVSLDGSFNIEGAGGAQMVAGGRFNNAMKGTGSAPSKALVNPQDALIGRLGGCPSEGAFSIWLKDSDCDGVTEEFFNFQEGDSNWIDIWMYAYGLDDNVYLTGKTSTSPTITGTGFNFVIPKTSICNNEWHNIGLTWNSSDVCGYMDGISLGCNPVAGDGTNGGF